MTMSPLLVSAHENRKAFKMLIEKMTALRDFMNGQGVMFCFTGFLSEEVLGGIAIALKKKLEQDRVSIRDARSVFSVVVELSQNIIRYSAEHSAIDQTPASEELRYGVLAVGQEQNHYYVSCGNLIANDDAKRLSESLNHIKGLDRQELKALYKTVLRQGPPEGSKGAGVGFIEIALRASQGFEFDLQPSAGKMTFFALKAII